LIVAGIYIGAVLITPAQAHFLSSISHIIGHAKEVFYTKSQSNSRFLNVGEITARSKRVANMNDIACNADTVVDSMTVNVPKRSRIWVDGQGAYRADNSGQGEFGLYLRLRNAGNTTTLATSAENWDSGYDPSDADTVQVLSTGGTLFAGADTETAAPVYEAPAGTYILQLVVHSGSGPACTTDFPDFGVNQGGVMGYILLPVA
jgi:hypothetical protein